LKQPFLPTTMLRRLSTVAKPKRPASAYLLFANSTRQQIANENPQLRTPDIAKIQGQKWKELNDNQKKPFLDAAEKDKERYAGEMKKYEATAPEDREPEKEKTAGSRQRKNPDVKAPLSAYIIFTQHKRKEVVAKNPLAKVPEIGKLLGDMWRKMGEKDKQQYVDLAKKDRERYEAEIKSKE
jgi:hypothetical protein